MKKSREELNKTRAITHGASVGGKVIPEYNTWSGMKNRCLNPKLPSYPNYGGRGITVCERWIHSFSNFLVDMGYKPSPAHSIERIDNNKGYSPDNCRWATDSEQMRNRRPHWLHRKRDSSGKFI